MKSVEQLLHKTIGLDVASVGPPLVHRIVRSRMKSLGVKKLQDYHRALETVPSEWGELLESVLVKETWFFRDPAAFTGLVRLVLEEWLPAHPTGPLRLLSLPCSSGEEPYSLVMALLDAGVPSARFRVDAADLSARALAQAKKAMYGRNSFRGPNLDFRDRYFHAGKDGFALAPAIRQHVRFSEGNLLSPDYPAGAAQYDFIFCRNLLIYFDRPTQHRALDKLAELLTPNGTLFVGPAEQPTVLNYGFVTASIPMAFASRKPGLPAAPAAPRARPPKPVRLPLGIPRDRLTPMPPRTVPAAEPRSSAAPAELEQARRLADAGRLTEAAALCEAHLRQNQTSAQGYYLLGLVRDAEGDPTAVDCYRKALYLQPDHYEALMQMALLAQRKGDRAQARTFERRARRVTADI